MQRACHTQTMRKHAVGVPKKLCETTTTTAYIQHGFCAARGDFRDANVARRAGEAVDAVAAFFVDVLAL